MDILHLRRQFGLTQAQGANLLGVSISTWWRLEKGRIEPTPDQVEMLDQLDRIRNFRQVGGALRLALPRGRLAAWGAILRTSQLKARRE